MPTADKTLSIRPGQERDADLLADLAGRTFADAYSCTLSAEDLDANVSVKPTFFGLLLDHGAHLSECCSNLINTGGLFVGRGGDFSYETGGQIDCV